MTSLGRFAAKTRALRARMAFALALLLAAAPDALKADGVIDRLHERRRHSAIGHLVQAGFLMFAGPRNRGAGVAVDAPPVEGPSVFRGATLPHGITYNDDTEEFDGTVWDESGHDVGSAAWLAAIAAGHVTTIATTGSTGHADLRAALATNAALDYDTIIVTPVADLTSSEEVILPAKTHPTRRTWIVSAKVYDESFSCAQGTRVRRSHDSQMTRLQAANLTGVVGVADSPNVRRYIFAGIVFEPATSNTSTSNYLFELVRLRRNSSPTPDWTTSVSEFVFDRCIWRGGGGTDRLVYFGIRNWAAYVCIKECNMYNIYADGNESKAILADASVRYFKIINSTVSSVGINIFTGQGGVQPEEQVPQDCEYRRLHIWKDPTWWQAGAEPNVIAKAAGVKNLDENKSIFRKLLVDCVLENCWTSAQTGPALVCKNTENWQDDVVMAWLRIKNCARAADIISQAEVTGANTRRMVCYQWDCQKIGPGRSDFSGGGYSIAITGSPEGLVMDHLTVEAQGGLISMNPNARSEGDVVLTNCVMQTGVYGINNAAGGVPTSGEPALSNHFPGGATFAGNVLITDSIGVGFSPGAGNTVESVVANVGFTNYATGVLSLSGSSPYLTAGVGGVRPGCDYVTLNTRLTGVRDVDL